MLILFIFIRDVRQKVAQPQLTGSQAFEGMRRMQVARRPCSGENSAAESQATCKATSELPTPAVARDSISCRMLVQTTLLM